MMNRRIGRFEISDFWLDEESIPNVLDRCLVLNVEHDYVRGVLTYTAIHPAFRELKENEQAPTYEGIFADGRRSPCWVLAR